MTEQEYTPQFDFLHFLQDTILLLGGKKEIRDLLEKLMDGTISPADVDKLRNYNTELFTSAKDRLAFLHTIKIKPSTETPQ